LVPHDLAKVFSRFPQIKAARDPSQLSLTIPAEIAEAVLRRPIP
jgi:hypothetical protein